MKLIKASYRILPEQQFLEDCYKAIEFAGRITHESTDKITEDSAKLFVDKMIKLGHTAMLEHGTVYLKRKFTSAEFREWLLKYKTNPYSIVPFNALTSKGFVYVTTNYRVLYENGWLDDLKYICAPTKYHERRYSVEFICDRGITHELVRHRKFSFAQESTRYCNYSKNKFGNELTFILPCWCNNIEPDSGRFERYKYNNEDYFAEQIMFEDNADWLENLQNIEDTYFNLLSDNWKPEQARSVLPNALKSDIIMTGFLSDWKNFFKLRTAISAHPQMRELMLPLEKELISKTL